MKLIPKQFKNIYIFLIPLFYNLFLNYKNNELAVVNFGFYDLFSSLLIFIFLVLVGYCFKSVFSNMTITFGIITYLISFFIFETTVLFFYKDLNISNTFYITNLIWILFYFLFIENKKIIFSTVGFYFLMYYFNNFSFEMMNINSNIIGDVKDVFFPNTTMIYDTSYKNSVSNPIMSGYPQFMSYIDAIIFKISFGHQYYKFAASSSYIFFWLYLLLFSELKTNKHNKLFISLLFFVLIVNSSWLQFLFVSSLMSERIAGYFLAGILTNLFKIKDCSRKEVYIIFFILGFVYNTKQFFSVIVIILFFIFLFTEKYRKGSIFILGAWLLKEISYITYFANVPKDHHISQIDLKDTIQDLILLRDLNFSNVIEILQNLVIDKPFTYLLLLTLIFCIYVLIKGKTKFELNLYIFISFLNLLFIFLLYISAWRAMELESPVRYIYSFLIFYLLIIANSMSKKN